MADGNKQESRPQQPPLPASIRLEEYQVMGPGKVLRNGKTYGEGDMIELTEKEAKEFGTRVLKGGAGPLPPVGKRQAGIYEILGPGSIFKDGKLYEPGSSLQLTERDANTLDVGMRLKKPA